MRQALNEASFAEMNPRQKYTLILAVFFIIIMILFPPYFGIDTESEGRVHAFIGYHPIWSPPSSEYVYEALTSESAANADAARVSSFQARLNKVQLIINFLILVSVTAGALIVFRRGRKST